MEASSASKGIFDGANSEQRDHVIELLTKAYWMEIETVMSYLAASVNLDGVRAQEIKESLNGEVEDELGHARQSRLLGPLYLPVVGVPSTIRVAYAFVYKHARGKRWGGYYDGFPEKWADELGGVDRSKRPRP